MITGLLSAVAARGAAMAPPQVPPEMPGLADAVLGNLERGRADDAARRLDEILAKGPSALLAPTGQTRLSVEAWVRTLPPAQRTRLVDAYTAAFSAAGEAALRRVQASDTPTERACLDVAARYPFTPSAARALRQAALAAQRRGDLVSAADLSQSTPTDTPREAPSTQPYQGPVPAAQRWWDRSPEVFARKYVPVAAGGVAYVAGHRDIAAIGPDGRVLWHRSPEGFVDANPPVHAAATGRGAVYWPALLTDVRGQAQVLVARQASADAGEACLRAVRASDGKALWSTEQETERSLAYVSAPAVAGRYVYALAVDQAQSPSVLTMQALDVLTGARIWQTVLGQLDELPADETDKSAPQAYWEQGPVRVAGRWVVAAPGVGWVVALDRFTGTVRWMRQYTPGGLGDVQAWRTYRLSMGKQPGSLDPTVARRWINTPAVSTSSVVAAPFDTPGTLGLDLSTGQVEWTLPASPEPSLVGSSGGVAIFAGQGISAVDMQQGKVIWTFHPSAGEMTGSPVVRDGQVLAPTAGGLLALDAATGARQPPSPEPPSWSTLMQDASVRGLLEAMQALNSFDRR